MIVTGGWLACFQHAFEAVASTPSGRHISMHLQATV